MSSRRSTTSGKIEGGATGGIVVERKVGGDKSDQLSDDKDGGRKQNKYENDVCPVC